MLWIDVRIACSLSYGVERREPLHPPSRIGPGQEAPSARSSNAASLPGPRGPGAAMSPSLSRCRIIHRGGARPAAAAEDARVVPYAPIAGRKPRRNGVRCRIPGVPRLDLDDPPPQARIGVQERAGRSVARITDNHREEAEPGPHTRGRLLRRGGIAYVDGPPVGRPFGQRSRRSRQLPSLQPQQRHPGAAPHRCPGHFGPETAGSSSYDRRTVGQGTGNGHGISTQWNSSASAPRMPRATVGAPAANRRAGWPPPPGGSLYPGLAWERAARDAPLRTAEEAWPYGTG